MGGDSPVNCWSLVVARGLTVAEKGGYRAPLPLLPTNTSTSSKWGAVYSLGYFATPSCSLVSPTSPFFENHLGVRTSGFIP